MPDTITTAEVGSLSLEWLLLSHLTGKQIYADYITKAMSALRNSLTADYLAGTILNINTLKWTQPYTTIGANQDSFFEYLFKVYQAFGDEESLLLF